MTASDTVQTIALDQLTESPFNPRKTFHETGLAELAASIREQGILQPILVRRATHAGGEWHGTYEIVCGHRRTRAARRAGLADVPALVCTMTDQQAAAAAASPPKPRASAAPLALSGPKACAASSIYATCGLCSCSTSPPNSNCRTTPFGIG